MTTNLVGKVAAVGLCACLVMSGGCRSNAQTGALAGAGMGALMGQVIGASTGATLIGAAVGVGAGHIIGSEMDRRDAREEQQRRDRELDRRNREHDAAIRDLRAQQAELERQNAQTPTTGTFIPPAWPSSTDQMRPLADTAWRVVSMSPPPRRAFESMTLHFQPNGHLITTVERPGGAMEVDSETYRVVGNTLIINDTGYLTNSTWTITGNRLTLVCVNFRTVLERIGDGD